MSIMVCEKHDRFFDSDFYEECPDCANEIPTMDEWQDLMFWAETIAFWVPRMHQYKADGNLFDYDKSVDRIKAAIDNIRGKP